MSHKKLTIGLFGFGVVGEGIYQVLKETPSLQVSIKKVCIRDINKKRSAPLDLFTTDRSVLLNDPEINLIVELIDDAEESLLIVRTALSIGKAVVSANKKMIAENLEEILQLQKKHGLPVLYEGAVCGSVPVIRNLEEYYDNDMLKSICGVVNGSTNFILTQMTEGSKTYNEALMEAKQLGFAESNPTLDVSGLDAVNKLTILLLHAYGIQSNPESLLYSGITSIQTSDLVVANEKKWKVKLIARAVKLRNGKILAFVLPHFVTADSQLYEVKNEYNGVVIESKLADKQFLYGKGAGRYPTSSAVLSDIAALRYDYKYEYRKLANRTDAELTSDAFLKIYVSFSNWNQVNKWDFESIQEFHSSSERQYLIGLIHFKKLQEAEWIQDENVSVIVMPEGVTEKDVVLQNSLKKISLQVAGSY
jgi:homoserine dehydrogenase